MLLSEIDITGYDTLFIDRDGVINRHRPNDYVKCWEEFEFLPGVLDTLSIWSKQLKHILVVTNQRGVGKGVMSENDLTEIHSRMISQIEASGGRVDKVYYCTALTDEDPCRKPNIGMGMNALADFPDIDLDKAIMIGDSHSDIEFAKNLGINGFLFKML